MMSTGGISLFSMWDISFSKTWWYWRRNYLFLVSLRGEKKANTLVFLFLFVVVVELPMEAQQPLKVQLYTFRGGPAGQSLCNHQISYS